MNKTFKLRYLTLFYKDLKKAIEYISNNLSNPKAANKLLDDIELAIKERLPECDLFEPYKTKKKREHDYYYIKVRNFMIFYVILIENGDYIMECRRLLYKSRNIDNLLW